MLNVVQGNCKYPRYANLENVVSDAIVEIHNKTNARFVSGVSGQTDYLISSRKDTTKAKRAKSFGTQVIDEAEMIAFIKAGNFPVKRV